MILMLEQDSLTIIMRRCRSISSRLRIKTRVTKRTTTIDRSGNARLQRKPSACLRIVIGYVYYGIWIVLMIPVMRRFVTLCKNGYMMNLVRDGGCGSPQNGFIQFYYRV